MSKSEQFKALVEQMVRREVKRVVPQLVKETLSNMILESRVEVGEDVEIPNNSYKRQRIQEQTQPEMEPYPTMTGRPFDRSRMAEIMGPMDDFTFMGESRGGRSQPGLITAPAIHHETGTAINVPVSDELLNAFNRDYRPLMKAIDKNKNHG